MPFLNPQDAEIIRRRFAADLERDVRLLLFLPATGGLTLPGQDAEIAEYARRIVGEVATLSDRLRVEEYSVISYPEEARAYGVTQTPTLVFLRDGDAPHDDGVRYVGLPAGYEFVTLLELIVMVSRGAAALAPETQDTLAALSGDAHLQVFVTPT